MRALQPVPVGERSILPGRTTTAFDPVQPPSRFSKGPANWQNEICAQSGFSGWTKPSWALAAAMIFTPHSARSRASSGVMAKPSAWALTMTKVSPP